MFVTPRLSLVAAALALAACTDADTDGGGTAAAGHETIRSSLARDTTPDVEDGAAEAIGAGNRALAVELFHRTADEGANHCASAWSIQQAFALVYAGARGQTATEMASVLHFGDDAAVFHAAMNAIDLALTSRNLPEGVDSEGNPLDPVELRVANAFWGQTGYAWLDDYLDTIAVSYGAGIETLDFETDAEAARQTINSWVEDRTNDRIVDLLPEGSIDSSTAAVLTNAIYFKAPWATPFNTALTDTAPFERVGGATVDVDFMNQLEPHLYAAGEGWQALEMSFRGDELAMVFILPEAGQFESFEASLDGARLDAIVSELEPAMVDIALPKFSFETGFTLSEALQAMGMTTAFSDACDLSGMLEGGGLFIDEAYHKAFVAVDEHGAEAAAATAVVVGETSIPDPDAEFVANHPFFFAIRDRQTGIVLFFGRVVDPSA